MCGRYASSRKPEDLVEEFEVDRVVQERPLPADFNVAPTKEVYAVMDRVPHDAPEGTPPERRLTTLTWGLVPSWAKDPKIGSRMINARLETLTEKPAFKRAVAKRRCLLPADGYFEWYETDQIGARGKPLKQPFYITPKDGEVMAMAGLYEIWRNKEIEDPDAPGAFLWTSTVITTSAEDAVGHIHDRMPMLVEPSSYDAWLDASLTEFEDLAGVLVPAAPGRLDAYPVSTAVNNVRNNGAELIDPLPIEPPTDDAPATLFDS